MQAQLQDNSPDMLTSPKLLEHLPPESRKRKGWSRVLPWPNRESSQIVTLQTGVVFAEQVVVVVALVLVLAPDEYKAFRIWQARYQNI